MTTQLDFINESLLSIGERDFMTATLTSAAQRRVYATFKDTFTSFTHESEWSFLFKTVNPTVWTDNIATVPQFQTVQSVFSDRRKLFPMFPDEFRLFDVTVEGVPFYYSIVNSTSIAFYQLPSAPEKLKIKVHYTEDLQLPAYSGAALIPMTDDFTNIMKQLMSAKLCLQVLDDQGGYNTFMREYMVRLAKAIQRDQRITRARPNMFRGFR